MPDRFRPDAAVRRVSPHPGNVPATGNVFRDHPRTGFKGLSHEEATIAVGKAIEDAIEDGVVAGMTDVARAAARESFEDHGPTAGEGRRSFPRSHRGEGRNFVD